MSRRGRPSGPKLRLLFGFLPNPSYPTWIYSIYFFHGSSSFIFFQVLLITLSIPIFDTNHIINSSMSSGNHPTHNEEFAAECSLAPLSSILKPAGVSTVETSSSSSSSEHDVGDVERDDEERAPHYLKQPRSGRIRCNVESVGRWALLALLGTALFGSIYTNLSCHFLSIHFDDDQDAEDNANIRLMMELFGREDVVTVGIFGYDGTSMSSTKEMGGLTWETYSLEDCIAYPSQFYKTPLGPFWAASQFASFLAAVVGGMAFLLHLVGIFGHAPNHLLAPLLWLTSLAVLVQGFTFVVYGDLEAWYVFPDSIHLACIHHVVSNLLILMICT